ncbi:MAG: hypothetical protein IPJ78_00465 [Gemmatimonadetes bacterium]|nr:hypothetical protein [Gemmatimonadota bacterium]
MDLISLALLASHAFAAPSVVASADAPTVEVVARGHVGPADGPVRVVRFLPPVARDTVVDLSAAYYTRLSVHRAASYTMLPLFAFQYLAGRQLYDKSFEAPAWARTGHRVAATGVAALFAVNTVTGVMNLYEARREPEGRGRRVFHAVMMLAADAGFTATGILAERAEGSNDDRDLHRAVALGSVAVATIGYLTMLDVFRRD